MTLSGLECQCVACEVVFGGLRDFDRHQKWKGKGDKAKLTCLDPAGMGLEARERRDGTLVWVRPIAEEFQAQPDPSAGVLAAS